MKKFVLIILSLLISLPFLASTALAANYTAADVAAHGTASDCWMIINNNVYNLTALIPTHSGGPFISSRCGNDGSALFNGQSHSAGALNKLNSYLIGTLIIKVLTSVSITPVSPSVVQGGTIQLVATPKDQNAATFGSTTTTFLSSNMAVATVNNSGLVSAISQGSATITATTVSGTVTVTGTTNLTVTAPIPVLVLTNVSVSPANFSIMAGETKQLTVSTLDQNNNKITAAVTFASSDNAIATVANNGLVTGVSAGSTKILVTAISGSITLTGTSLFTVTAIPVLTTNTISPTSANILTGAEQQLAISTFDQNGTAIGATLSFQSSDPAIATVSSSGLVKGVSAGSAVITVTAVNGATTVTSNSAITVIAPAPAAILSLMADHSSSSITISPSLIPNTNGKANDNALVETTFNGVTPIKVSLANGGNANSANVRISAINAGSNIQLWAKDTLGDWYDINVTGWGPATGFSVAMGSSLDTNVYAIADKTGTYPLTVNLVLVSDSSIITNATGTVNAGPIAQTSPINLLSAGNFAILSKSGITDIPTSTILGNIGSSPIAGSGITGITTPQVTGIIYTVDASGPASSTPNATLLTKAIRDMEAAYTSAAGLPSGVGTYLNRGGGILGGLTLAPGVYTFGNSVTIPTDLTLSGGTNDVWIFQISGTLNISAAKKIILSGGAQAQNIYWQVAGETTLGANSVFNGNILDKTGIALQTGATLNGRALAQTSVTLDQNTISIPNPSDTANITVFTFSSGTGIINEANHSISVSVPNGTNVTSLAPTITITGKSISPNSGVAQNFTNPFVYTVMAANSTTKDYTVTVAILPAPSTGGGNGGGGGGGGGGGIPIIISACTTVNYGEWGSSFNGIQYRNISSTTPNYCTLTTEQRLAAHRSVDVITNQPIKNPTNSTPEQEVLGEKIYVNGTLLKGSNNKIYVVMGSKLYYISKLSELAKYKGPTLKVDDSVINSLLSSVLGTKVYTNGTLLKGSNNKIYVVLNGKLQYITSLKKLAKYKGPTLKVDDSVINSLLPGVLGVKVYANGSLIRAFGDNKIYFVMNGKKIQIMNLSELRKYAGKVITNITASELKNY